MVGQRESRPDRTPLTDYGGLKHKGIIKTRGQLWAAEAENIRKAMVKYLGRRLTRRSARFDLSWAKRLHKEMLGDVWSWAGEFRRSEKTIGVPWHQIESRLYSLLHDLRHWEQQEVELIKQAVWLHHGAVAIHPFEDGNGRWSRMLGNIWLRLHRQPLTEWPQEISGGESAIRSEYIEAIKQADAGDFALLLDLHRRFTRAT